MVILPMLKHSASFVALAGTNNSKQKVDPDCPYVQTQQRKRYNKCVPTCERSTTMSLQAMKSVSIAMSLFKISNEMQSAQDLI